MLDPYVVKDRTLIDPEKHLTGVDGVLFPVEAVQCRFAPLKPSRGPLAGSLDVFARRWDLDAFVESHSDIGSQV